MLKFLKLYRANENGATAIEYALGAAVIAALIAAGASKVGDGVNSTFASISQTIDQDGASKRKTPPEHGDTGGVSESVDGKAWKMRD